MNSEMTFTVAEAMDYAKRGIVEEWVHLFLSTVGNNIPFSDGLKLQKRYWVGPVSIDLDELSPCCGPEETMEYVMDSEKWNRRINQFQQWTRSGWDIPPLIASHNDGVLSLRDGNHRYEAMKREGIKRYWVIIWDNEDEQNLIKYINSCN